MRKKPPSLANELADRLGKDLSDIAAQARGTELTPHGRRILSREIEHAADLLSSLLSELDPTKRPETIFDPGNPRTVAFFIALALTAQPRRPLSQLQEFYGSGVYAIYYSGPFDIYAPLRSTETPIGRAGSQTGRPPRRAPEKHRSRIRHAGHCRFRVPRACGPDGLGNRCRGLSHPLVQADLE